MIPQTIGREFSTGRIVPVQCVKGDKLEDINIKGNCFLMLIIHQGSAYFKVGAVTFEATGPCFVCFDETEQPELVKKDKLICDSIYFHPIFLNVNMTFERIHHGGYEQVALNHDLFLLKPFTDTKRFVFPVPEECADSMNTLFTKMESELNVQHDWYWSCRSRSFFMEAILLLERAYGIVGQEDSDTTSYRIRNPHLKNAVIYIESHYQENLTLDNIVKSASMSHSTLTKLFKTELNITPVEYLWQYRITAAKKHLEFTSLPVKDIAIRCGFKTIQHFSRKFEKYTGKTPTAFRNTAVAKRKADFQTI